MSKTFSLPFTALLALASGAVMADVDVRVGAGGGCATSSIQNAINGAVPANGITNILIARNATYQTDWLNITSKNVRLIGGYENCLDTTRDDVRTVIDGAGGRQDSVIKVRGTSSVVAFYNLDIVNGDALSSGGRNGGGVEIEDGPHALVYFENTWIANNRAAEGGGLWIKNEVSSNTNDVFVVIGSNTRLFGNQATAQATFGTGDGGGLFCFNARVSMVSGTNTLIGSHIADNVASGSGGGIRAENCVMNIAARHINLGTLSGNTADANGGAISVSGGRSVINLYNTNADAPTLIDDNSARGVGGGIDIGSSARVNAYDIIISNNTSFGAGGGAVSVFDNDATPHATFLMKGTLGGAPNVAGSPEGVAVNCTNSRQCNRISGNNVFTPASNDRPGAAIRASAGGGDQSDQVFVYLEGTHINSNEGKNLIDMSGDEVFVSLNGVSVTNNTLYEYAFQAASNLHQLRVFNSTIAGNLIQGSATFRSSMDGSAPSATFGTQFKRSIHWQPGKQIYSVVSGTVNGANTDFVLSNDLGSLPTSTHNMENQNPLFVGNGIYPYQLTLNSPAVDWVSANANDPTADHLPRVKDLVSNSNDFGPQDLGAYELQLEGDVNIAPVLTLPAALTVNEDSLGTGLIFGFNLSDGDGDVDGRLTLSVPRASAGIDALMYPIEISVTGTSIDPNDTWYPNVVTLTGQMDSIVNTTNTFTAFLLFNPKPDFNGSVPVTFALSDLGNTGLGGELVDTEIWTVNVTSINDRPFFTLAQSSIATSILGVQSVAFANIARTGPANESAQSLINWEIVAGSFDDPDDAIEGTPSLSSSGVLTFQTRGAGQATLSLSVRDDGGVANGGVDGALPLPVTIIMQGTSAIFANGFE